MTEDDRIERIARVLYTEMEGERTWIPWDRVDGHEREHWRALARKVLAEIGVK